MRYTLPEHVLGNSLRTTIVMVNLTDINFKHGVIWNSAIQWPSYELDRRIAINKECFGVMPMPSLHGNAKRRNIIDFYVLSLVRREFGERSVRLGVVRTLYGLQIRNDIEGNLISTQFE